MFKDELALIACQEVDFNSLLSGRGVGVHFQRKRKEENVSIRVDSPFQFFSWMWLRDTRKQAQKNNGFEVGREGGRRGASLWA